MAALLTAAQDLAMLVTELGEARREGPAGRPHHGAGDRRGRRRDASRPAELASFFILLVVAGNETTRNAISHGLQALTEHPDQMARWQADFDGLRRHRGRGDRPLGHAGDPLPPHRAPRTAPASATTSSTQGDKVVLWYASANRDAAVFDDPFRFDVGRTPNDHLGFGGPGPHFCLGAHLARREITVMFRELFRRMPDIRADGRAGPAAVELHQRHQAPAGVLDARGRGLIPPP